MSTMIHKVLYSHPSHPIFLYTPLPLHPDHTLEPRNNNTRILSIKQHSNLLQRRAPAREVKTKQSVRPFARMV
jgi:hypothetical protein